MTRVVSATQARIHFGELIRWVTETQQPAIVERDGQPCVVVLPVEVYRRLQEAQGRPQWQEVLNQVREFRAQLQAQRSGQPLPPPEEVIWEIREERDAELTGLR
ncbi:type II toxin-antitoxin system Phd/YefM family antitoxin [Thermoflexus sp.]|uniref:type II toxin-antitoxin system Phd/YefM family antitoxin n=1 Tax=Thermoflexus sp. TaxID=1969742 RepID=UPI00260C8669|nr:type II toxin-antitoxin system Phd/YefM family antitoxin [Thermoflexus sp.]MCX7689687.1 type II toxin-antitoxin system Phd/YefM family antitoxin [Thermoflexus sp.]